MEESSNGCKSTNLDEELGFVDRHRWDGARVVLCGDGLHRRIEFVDGSESTTWENVVVSVDWDDLTTGRGSMVWVDVPFVPGADGIVYERSEWWRG